MLRKKSFQAGETRSTKYIGKDIERTKDLRINPKKKLSDNALGTVGIRVFCRMAMIMG